MTRASNVLAAVASLERILPAADGVYVGGVMIGLSWGEPVLARILLAFLYDTSSPSQLTLLGTVSVLLPEKSPLVKVHVDIVGRFSADPFAIDVLASLRDSTLAGMVLSGDAALQLHTGPDSLFLLVARRLPPGVHAARRIPDAAPDVVGAAQQPAAAAVADRLLRGHRQHPAVRRQPALLGRASTTCSGWPVTPRSTRLIEWDPLHFEAALNVDVHVELAGHTLFGATLKGSLSGPGPWHVEGGVYVEVLWWEAKVYEVDTDFGSAPGRAAADGGRSGGGGGRRRAVVGELVRYGARSPGCCSAPPGPRAAGGLLMSPSASLSLVQDRVPLGLLLDHVGGAPAGGTRMASLGTVSIDGVAAGTDPLHARLRARHSSSICPMPMRCPGRRSSRCRRAWRCGRPTPPTRRASPAPTS